MAYPRRSLEQLRQALEAVAQHGNQSAAARALGIPIGTFQHIVSDARDQLGERPPAKTPVPAPAPFEVPDLVEELPSAQELLAQRRRVFDRKHAAKEARQLVPVTVRLTGPIGLLHGGDPHVDDDGTDIALLERHVALVQQTEGLFAGNVGDFSNNWIGRLARLYGDQTTSAREAWVLVEWLITSVRWLYLIGGNHDVWSGAGDPITWLAKQANSLYQSHGARLGLTFPDGRVIRVNARHDFKGHSMWNTAHGPVKAATMGWRDHILACGHTHVSGYQVVKDPASGLISHALRIGSYKRHDAYADQLGLGNAHIFCAPVTILDTRFADDDPRLVTTFFDPEPAAEYLTWLRQKAARGSRQR